MALIAISPAALASPPELSVRKSPGRAPDWAATAYKMRLAGQAHQAEKFLTARLTSGPANGAAWFELARTRFCLSLAEAKSNSEKTADKPRAKAPPLNLAPLEQAIARALEAEPANPRYHLWDGVITLYAGMAQIRGPLGILGAVGQVRKALASFEKAVALDPSCHDARLMLIALYHHTPLPLGGNKAKAEEHARALEKRSVIAGAKGRAILLAKDHKADLIPLWQKIADKYPRSADAHEGLGEAFLTNGNLEKGAAAFEEALRLDPARPRLLLRLASHCAYIKEYAPAEKILRQFLAHKPAANAPLRGRALRELAAVLLAQNQPNQAERARAEAQKIDPAFSDPGFPLEDLYREP